MLPLFPRELGRAPVSLPLNWRDLAAADLREDHFNVRSVPDRVIRRGEPWDGFFALQQKLPRLG